MNEEIGKRQRERIVRDSRHYDLALFESVVYIQ